MIGLITIEGSPSAGRKNRIRKAEEKRRGNKLEGGTEPTLASCRLQCGEISNRTSSRGIFPPLSIHKDCTLPTNQEPINEFVVPSERVHIDVTQVPFGKRTNLRHFQNRTAKQRNLATK